eukprot:gene9100-12295_t
MAGPRAARATGMAQMPAIELADGRWMTDTTAIIAWIEARRSGPEVTPRDPALRFYSLLLEDYADEWLWRPALHYRWSFQPDTALMGRRIAAEMLRDVPGPLDLRTALTIAIVSVAIAGAIGLMLGLIGMLLLVWTEFRSLRLTALFAASLPFALIVRGSPI